MSYLISSFRSQPIDLAPPDRTVWVEPPLAPPPSHHPRQEQLLWKLLLHQHQLPLPLLLAPPQTWSPLHQEMVSLKLIQSIRNAECDINTWYLRTCISCFSVGSATLYSTNLCFYPGNKQTIFLFCAAKECRVQETRQTSPTANKENIKPLDSSPSITRPVCKGIASSRGGSIGFRNNASDFRVLQSFITKIFEVSSEFMYNVIYVIYVDPFETKCF